MEHRGKERGKTSGEVDTQNARLFTRVSSILSNTTCLLKRKENIFSDSKWCLRFGYGAENKICSIKETQDFLFYLVQKKKLKKLASSGRKSLQSLHRVKGGHGQSAD